MCGICGFYSKQDISYEKLSQMAGRLAHRGPDDSGIEIIRGKDGYGIGMAHRRLSILDLSSAGHQPMHSYDNRLTVVFNGEIYNYTELRDELSDYPYQSHCDTEVILASYLRWGKNLADWAARLDGMFAIALYDKARDQLVLIRDRMGKKPLYNWSQDQNIVFASELKPIMMTTGFPGKLNRSVLHRYMLQSYINAPNTIFEDVYQLEPGGILSFSMGETRIARYWDIYDEYRKGKRERNRSYRDCKGQLKEKIIFAVKKRMTADVPIGTFLSGGYDSSLVTAIAQSLSDVPIKTFSIGVEDRKLDEAGFAKQISKYLGTDHTEWYFSEKELLELVETLPEYYDEPMADSSQLPAMLVSKLAREKVTVVLSGDGGDELFCGYPSYINARIAQKLDTAGAALHIIGKLPFGTGSLESLYPLRVRIVSQNRDRRYSTQLISSHYTETTKSILSSGYDYLPPKYDESRIGIRSWQIRKMMLDMKFYLPGDILTKVDRASMKYSLEARCPLLDTEVVRYSFRIPQNYKYRNGNLKYILKEIGYDYIPKKLLDRPKQGFSIPISRWLTGSLKNQLLDFSNEDYLRKQGIFDPKAANRMVAGYLKTGDEGPGTGNNFSHICWNFFVFQRWHEYYTSFAKY